MPSPFLSRHSLGSRWCCRSFTNWLSYQQPASAAQSASCCHLQRSAETELCTASLQHLPQHVGSKQHLYQSSSHTYDLLLFSAPQRPQHGQKSAHCDIILILFLPPGQPIAAEYLPDRRRCLAVRCLLVLRRRRLQNVLSPGVVMQPSLCCQPLDLTHLNSLSFC